MSSKPSTYAHASGMTSDGASALTFARLCWTTLGVRQRRCLIDIGSHRRRGLSYPAEVKAALRSLGYLVASEHYWELTPLGVLVREAGTKVVADER